MEIKNLFAFLIEDFKLEYRHQEFDKCYGGNWTVNTHSFYNESGCFTIYSLVQHGGELDFYYAPVFSTNLEELCDKLVDISSIEKEVWKKHTKFGVFPRPFFWLNNRKVLEALSEVLSAHINKHGEFFGIKVEKNNKFS
ncbi:MAG: hypothetical protein IJB11_03060 [Oscillospiraceae bacterium]|nr:hypothetical protein [Oscillospiraceae bacterium]